MKRKLMIALLCLAMTAALFACSAGLAEDVISVETLTTEQLANALKNDSAYRNNTLKLEDDFTLSAPDGEFYSCEQPITIDLNGHTLALGAATIKLNSYSANLVIKDSSTDQNGQITGFGGGVSRYLIAVQEGSLTVESGNVCGTVNGIAVNGDGILTISDGSVTAPNGAIYNKSGKVYINGGSVIAAGKTGLLNENGEVTVSGGTVQANEGAIYSTGSNGKVKVESGAVKATGDYAIQMDDGSLIIEDGTVEAASYAILNKGNCSVRGGSVTAAGAPTIYLAGSGSYSWAALEVTGGTITQNGHDEAISLIKYADVAVLGGTISATKSADGNGDGGIGFYLNNGTCQLTVSGGTVRAYCCGVYSNHQNATFKLSGGPSFTTLNTENADVELFDNSRITIAGVLNANPISVRREGDTNLPGVFTKNYGQYYNSDSAIPFTGKNVSIVWNSDSEELAVSSGTRGIAFTYDEDEGAPYAYYYQDEEPITSAYVGSTVHLDANPKPGFRLNYWEAPEGITIENDQLIMPEGEGDITITAYYERVYPITTDGSAVVGYRWSLDDYEPVTEAADWESLDIWLADNARPDDGYYFTGGFMVYVDGENGRELYEEDVDSFDMPSQAVYVEALQEEQEPLTLRFTTNPIPMSLEAFYQITGSDYGIHPIDLNGSGIPDVTLFYQYNDDDTEEFLALLLPDYDIPNEYTFADVHDAKTNPYSSIVFTIPDSIACVVSFDPGDPAASDTMDDVTVQMGDLYTLPACGFTAPEGMEFSEWRVTHADADGSVDQLSPGNEITVTENLTLTALWRVPNPEIMGCTLRLGGVLGMQYYVELPEGYETNPYYEGAYMTFSIPNQSDQVVPLSKATNGTMDGKDCKVFTCSVYAYQMNDYVNAIFSYGNGEAGDYFSCPLSSYLEVVRITQPQASALAAATETYGHYIQPYLASVNGWTVGEKYKEMNFFTALSESDVTAAAAATANHAYEVIGDVDPRVESAAYYLTLNADTNFTVKVTLADTYEDAEISVNSKKARTSVSGNTCTAIIPNIGAAALADRYTVTVKIGDDTVFCIELSPLSYVYTVLSKGTETYASEKLALASLYQYYAAAAAYINAQ